MNVPEIRFKGEQLFLKKQLKEIATINPKNALPDFFEYVDLESVVGTEMKKHRTEIKESAPSRAQRLANKGDIFFQTVRPYQQNNLYFDLDAKNFVFSLKSATTRLYDTEAKIICIVSKKGAQCIECHHKDI